MSSPLALAGWQEFNARRWNLDVLRVNEGTRGSNAPWLEAILYTDRRGRVVCPPLSPFLPIEFAGTCTRFPASQNRQWLELSRPLVEEMDRRDVEGRIGLSPDVLDVRPWKWVEFTEGVMYTTHLDLPLPEETVDPAVLQRVRKATRNGFYSRRVQNAGDVVRCLRSTEQRRLLRNKWRVEHLEMAYQILGDDHLRTYVCYTRDGEPACAHVVLHAPGGRAVSLSIGTRDEFLNSGATQLMNHAVLTDLAASGASGFDFSGTNLPGISEVKLAWGGQLIPFFTLTSHPVRAFIRRTAGPALILKKLKHRLRSLLER